MSQIVIARRCLTLGSIMLLLLVAACREAEPTLVPTVQFNPAPATSAPLPTATRSVPEMEEGCRFVPYGIGGDVPVFADPEPGGPVVAAITMGEQYPIIDRAGEWRVEEAGMSGRFYRIQLDELTTGWVQDLRGGLEGACERFQAAATATTTPIIAVSATAASRTPMAPTRTADAEFSAPPPAIEKPTATAAPAGLSFVSFDVAPAAVDPGETVTLTWQAQGDQVTICPTSRYILFSASDCRQVPLSGAMTYTIPMEAAGFQTIGFVLEVESHDPPERTTSQASVAFKCDNTWFFSDVPQSGVCPQAPIRIQAAVQRFERGMMIWFEEPGRYFILENAPTLPGDARKRVDVISDPLNIIRHTSRDIEAPQDRFAPQSGFGLVWRGDVQESPGYRERLGWALEKEFGYQTTWQCDDARPSGGLSWQTCHIEGPSGEVVVLHPLAGWSLVP